MDPLFLAYSYYRRKKYEQCTEICTQLLEKNPYDQVFLLIENVIFMVCNSLFGYTMIVKINHIFNYVFMGYCN